jgi:hypothetical protein
MKWLASIRNRLDRRRLPGDDFVDWSFETWNWLLAHFGGFERLQRRQLVLPTPDFFDVRADTAPREIARRIFDQVREHAGMSDWSCRLAEHENWDPLRDSRLPSGARQGPRGAAGTFRAGREVVITYDPEQTRDPLSLVATFAHELSHYLLHSVDELPPGGPELEEPATDLTAVFLGFGVFLANAAFHFEQFIDGTTVGWSASRQGYLDEHQLAYQVAVFAHLREIPLREFRRHLDPNPRATLGAAWRDLNFRHASRLGALRSQ